MKALDLEVVHRGVQELRGPLLVVRGVDRRRLGRVRRRPDAGADGEPWSGTGWCSRWTGTSPSSRCSRAPTGCGTGGTRVAFAGEPLRIPVGPAWLGRVCNGRGEPLDGGPPILAASSAPVAGLPLNPTRRRAARGAGPHRRLRDRRADHAGARPEAADLLGRRAAPPRARHPDRGPGHRRRRAVLRRLRGDGADPRGRRHGPRRPRGALGRRRAGAAPQHRRRPGHRADAHAADRADRRRAPGLRPRPPRARGRWPT